ncbi:hypothetical protein [Pedosphaera parvula]|nr:hypothetical protein [Pedosphaera parvula]
MVDAIIIGVCAVWSMACAGTCISYLVRRTSGKKGWLGKLQAEGRVVSLDVLKGELEMDACVVRRLTSRGRETWFVPHGDEAPHPVYWNNYKDAFLILPEPGLGELEKVCTERKIEIRRMYG